MTGCGWEDAPYWPSPLRCTGVCGARIDKLVGKALGRWPPSALSQRNRRLSGECRLCSIHGPDSGLAVRVLPEDVGLAIAVEVAGARRLPVRARIGLGER